MKKEYYKRRLSPALTREGTRHFYLNKYYNLYMNAYQINGVDYQQRDYFLRKMWSYGKIACFNIKNTKTETNQNGLFAFAPFSPISFNIYDYPVDISLINTRGVSFIPATPQRVDKDVVIGFAQRNKKSVAEMVEYFVDKIVNIEMLIDLQVQANKMPFLIPINQEDKAHFEDIINKLYNDEFALYVTAEDINKLKTLSTGSTYIIDKLYDYKQLIENELLTYLGINNSPSIKKEHLIVDEVNANNELIKDNSNTFIDTMKEFFENVKIVLGQNVTIELNKQKLDNEYNEDDESEGGKDEDGNIEEQSKI